MISHEHKCIFIHVPKTAGESIETALMGRPNWESDDPNYASLGLPEGSEIGKDKHYTIAQWKDHINFTNYFKFSFVRNPWDSAYSFYRYRKERDKFDHSFTDWVKLINPKFWKEFLSPLKYILLNNKEGVDFIGRFEDIEADWDYICYRLSQDIKLPHINKGDNQSDYVDHYDSISRDIVYEHLKEDIEYFNYKFEG